MAKQIILTQNDYGIELETQFVNDKKKPLDITDYDVRVKIIYNNETIDTILAGHKDNTNGIAYIVLEKEHLLNAGLYTTTWSVVDEDEHITAQENLYYFVKDLEGSEDDTITDLPIDADGILNKFKEVDDDLLELNKHTNNIYNELNHCNEHLDDIDIELKNIDKTIKIIEENNVTPDIQIGTITTLEPNQQPTVTKRGTDKNPIFDFGIPRGKQGREGVQGGKGEKGTPGQDGIDGKDGVTPNITIGTVTTLEAGEEAIVTREGTNENPIFNFGIPKGESGANISGSNNLFIDDNTTSTETTWSSSHIEDFINTNDDVIWSTVQGENLSVDYTKEGYLREIEIWGNTIQSEEDLSNIQHLGELYVDSEGRKQYKIEIESSNDNLYRGDSSMELGAWTKEGREYTTNKEIRCKSPFIPLPAGVKNGDTLYLILSDKTINCNTNMHTYDKNQAYLGTLSHTHFVNGIVTMKITDITKIAYFSFRAVSSNTNCKWGLFTKSQEFIPHKSFKTTLLLPCQLMKVGNISDRLYWDSSKGRYVIEKNIDKMNINNVSCSINWGTVGWEADEYRYGARFSNSKFKADYSSKAGVFSHGKYINRNTDEEPTFNALYGKADGGIFAIKILKTELESQDMAGLQKWLENKKAYSYQPLQTPHLIETDITEELKLPTFINNTYITINGGIQGSIKAKAPVDGGKVIRALQEENIKLKAINNIQDELINTTMLATDEMFMMLEPLLAETLSERSASKMVDMYVAMVQRGIKTIEQVPVRYREQVKKILDQLEN